MVDLVQLFENLLGRHLTLVDKLAVALHKKVLEHRNDHCDWVAFVLQLPLDHSELRPRLLSLGEYLLLWLITSITHDEGGLDLSFTQLHRLQIAYIIDVIKCFIIQILLVGWILLRNTGSSDDLSILSQRGPLEFPFKHLLPILLEVLVVLISLELWSAQALQQHGDDFAPLSLAFDEVEGSFHPFL